MMTIFLAPSLAPSYYSFFGSPVYTDYYYEKGVVWLA
jgi:hypothetical protein